MKNAISTKRITKNAILLALMCIVGMISIPISANVKPSLQLLMVFIICLTAESVFDCITITSLYLVLGLFLPIYAGFGVGVSPTFGFVISFVVISPVVFFLNKIPIKNSIIRMVIACLCGLFLCYFIGLLFMMLYLQLDFLKTVTIAVVPYLPFDAVKIYLAVLITSMLPKTVKARM